MERNMAKTIQRMFRLLENPRPKRQRRITKMSVNQIVRCYVRQHGPYGSFMPDLEIPEIFGYSSVAAAFAGAAADIERQLLRPALECVPGINPDDYTVAWVAPSDISMPSRCEYCHAELWS